MPAKVVLMTDELEKLKQAFKADRDQQPAAAPREAAISAAMDAFDEESAAARQGSGVWDRLRDTGNAVYHTIFGRRSMNTTAPSLKPYLLGGVSLAVISLAVLNVENLQLMKPELADMKVAESEQVKDMAIGGSNTPAPATVPLEEKVAGNKNAQVGAERRKSEADALRSDDVAGQGATVTQFDAPASLPAESGGKREREAVSSQLEKQLARTERGIARVEELIAQNQKRRLSEPSGSTLNSNKYRVAGKKKQDESSVASRIAPAPVDNIQPGYYRDQGRDKFNEVVSNPVKQVKQEPVSTFSIDVDTASYSFIRSSLNNGVLPPSNAVRIEEMMNYFPYDYELPDDREAPFATHATVMPTPWNTETKLLHIGIKGFDLPKSEKPRSNLVFLIDTSGSMNAPNKLPLLVNSFKLLLNTLDPDDTVSIVTYAGRAGTVLKPTKVADKAEILNSLNRLRSGGSTAGGAGISQAYQLAEQNYDKAGVNRVILATDGDFNVGITDPGELKGFVERKRKTGISLSVLGFGRGNYNDGLMQTLAQNGNGNAAYIDSLSEARKVLVEEAGSTLFTIAKDVKIQVEFNPTVISEYRLIGYETRLLKRQDFNNDRIDAGEIGAGHTVTAIYELTPVGSSAVMVDSLRYQDESTSETAAAVKKSGEYGFLKLRYKLPDGRKSKLLSFPISQENEIAAVGQAGTEVRFASAVAAFGQLLRGGRFTGEYSYDEVIQLAQGAKGSDEFGYRAGFINLVRLARSATGLDKQ